MGRADGQKKKLPRTGELIITKDGIPLMVLGRPRIGGEPDEMSARLLRMLEGSIVVLMPDGTPALHVPDTPASRPDFISRWEWGWDPITDGEGDEKGGDEQPGFTQLRGFR